MAKACCTIEEEKEFHSEGHNHDHDHDHGDSSSIKTYIPAIISFVLLLFGFFFEYIIKPDFFQKENFKLVWYLIAYVPVGWPVLKEAIENIRRGEFFTEFTLMFIATIGAFVIGKYAEGVSVMLFYTVGELFQDAAVNRARGNIKALLDVRPDFAEVFKNGEWKVISPEEIIPGERVKIKAGEKIPVDGVLLSESSSFNTAALTGESKPQTIRKDEAVLAGMVNLDKVIEIEATKLFADSSLSRILHMVQEASRRKAKTELFIRKFAKIYTPIVFFLAVALMFLPYFFVETYVFQDWFYRALIFLVISCPCALLISIPLGYFGGIGAASRNGILVKGSNFLDLLANAGVVVMDKTGTLTEGVFKVREVHAVNGNEEEFLNLLSALEINSTHPIAKAIVEYHPSELTAEDVHEISGHGLEGTINGKKVLAGNGKLMKKNGIIYDSAIDEIVESIVLMSVDDEFTGYVTIADEIKEDSAVAIRNMKKEGVSETVMLSGDKETIVQKVAQSLEISSAYGNLLPEDKVEKLNEIIARTDKSVVFVGDGINDAPVLAISDVGVAMGGMGSDVAIETADVVIQTDQPSKIPTAIRIGRKTKQIVIQNIILAFGVKVIVLILGAFGMASMWEAVFADVGVAFLAILNAIRIQRMKF